jgi:hypothetical protein
MGRLRERQEGRSSRTEEARLVDRLPLWLSAQVDLPGEDRNFGFGLFVDLCPTVVADQCLRRVIPIPGDPEGEPNAGSGTMIDAYAPVVLYLAPANFRSGLSSRDREQSPGPGHAFQLVLAAICELKI